MRDQPPILLVVLIAIALVGIGYALGNTNSQPEFSFYRIKDGYVEKSTKVLGSTGEMVWEQVPNQVGVVKQEEEVVITRDGSSGGDQLPDPQISGDAGGGGSVPYYNGIHTSYPKSSGGGGNGGCVTMYDQNNYPYYDCN